MDEKIRFGLSPFLEIRVGSLVQLTVEPVEAIGRPEPSHLVIKLVTINTLSIYRLRSVNREEKIFRGNRGSGSS
jgi:hypothetical protein